MMAELSAADRQRVSTGLQRYWSNLREVVAGMTKSDVLAAVNATDTWINDNQASYNTALPDAARNNLTADQKVLLFCAVALLRVDPGIAALLKRALGVEVD